MPRIQFNLLVSSYLSFMIILFSSFFLFTACFFSLHEIFFESICCHRSILFYNTCLTTSQRPFLLFPICDIDKYIWKFEQICFAIWTNIFQIYQLSIWKNIFKINHLSLQQFVRRRFRDHISCFQFFDFDKYILCFYKNILQFEQIYFKWISCHSSILFYNSCPSTFQRPGLPFPTISDSRTVEFRPFLRLHKWFWIFF